MTSTKDIARYDMYEDIVNKRPLQIIDAPCGKGKTSWAIQYMNKNPQKKYMFVTPYLNEVSRIQKECSGLDFVAPSEESGTKTNHLKQLIQDHQNIATTHTLFTLIDDETMVLLKTMKYTLIQDESMCVIRQLHISHHDLKLLLQRHIAIDWDSMKVFPTDHGATYEGRFNDVITAAKDGRLYCLGGTCLIWQLPPDLFRAFEEIYILTYLFKGQLQKYYFDFHDIPYHLNDIAISRSNQYNLTRYYPNTSDEEFRKSLSKNIDIYDGRLNKAVRNEPNYSWYKKRTKKEFSSLKKATYCFFINHIKGCSEENMWTTFKEWEEYLKGKGYTKGFVPHNARATNDYSHKKNLAYLIDRRLNPGISQYLRTKGIRVNEQYYALSELIQWVFRSAIRREQPISLFLPSTRMRTLFKSWMVCNSSMKKAA